MISPVKWLIKWEIGRVLKKIVPREFSASKNIDYFMVELKNTTEPNFEICVQKVTDDYFEGLSREGHSYERQTCLSWKFVKPSDIHVRRFLGNVQVQYTGFWDFFWGETIFHAERAQIKERFSQWLFNKRTKFRRNRMDLLRDMLELTIKESSKPSASISGARAKGAFDWFNDIYGMRAFGHPKWNEENVRFGLLLESLAISGDLKLENHKYEVTGQSMQTLSIYEEEERRHKQGVKHNWLIFFLTLVIALAAVAQAFNGDDAKYSTGSYP